MSLDDPKPIRYVVIAISEKGKIVPLADITSTGANSIGIFRHIDRHIRFKHKYVVASPETKQDPKMFKWKGRQWLL